MSAAIPGLESEIFTHKVGSSQVKPCLHNSWTLVFWSIQNLDKAVVDSPLFNINLVKEVSH